MKTDEDINAQVDALITEMCRRRLIGDQPKKAGWTMHHVFGAKVGAVPTKEFIAKKLRAGHQLRAGYFTTSVRGYHSHYVLVGPITN